MSQGEVVLKCPAHVHDVRTTECDGSNLDVLEDVAFRDVLLSVRAEVMEMPRNGGAPRFRKSPDVLVLLPAEGRTATIVSYLRISPDVQRPVHVIDLEESRERLDAAPPQTLGIRIAIRIAIDADGDVELARPS